MSLDDTGRTKTKNLYIEMYKTLMEEIEEDTNKWKNMLMCSWIRRVDIIKMPVLPKQSTDSAQSL